MSRFHFKYIIFLSVISIYFIFLGDDFSFKNNEKKNLESSTYLEGMSSQISRRRTNWKTILLWTDFFHSRNVWHSIFRRMVSGECEESRCQITINKKEITNADAVLFNAFNLRNVLRVPTFLKGHIYKFPNQSQRSPDQIFIFYSMESPQKLDRTYLERIERDYFNWTMGYRRDSDVFEPFGKVTKKPVHSPKNVVEYITQKDLRKKKFAIWIASSCYKHAPFLREKFIETFRRKVKVDIYGNCGRKCDDYMGLNIYGDTFGTSACERHVYNYAFYLSLENSLCDDYVTEKIFKSWNLGVIPVVFGGANYSTFAPPKSYIDYRDFQSISDLIIYMKKVASDHNLYNEYFKWKEDYDVEIGSPYDPFVCDLCKRLHQQSISRSQKSYESIYDWFVKKGNCQDSLGKLIQLN